LLPRFHHRFPTVQFFSTPLHAASLFSPQVLCNYRSLLPSAASRLFPPSLHGCFRMVGLPVFAEVQQCLCPFIGLPGPAPFGQTGQVLPFKRSAIWARKTPLLGTHGSGECGVPLLSLHCVLLPVIPFFKRVPDFVKYHGLPLFGFFPSFGRFQSAPGGAMAQPAPTTSPPPSLPRLPTL